MEQIGVEDICTARLFKVNDPNKPAAEEEKKGGEADAEEQEPANEREQLFGEMASLETLGLQNGGRLEVEVYFTIEVSVQGIGAGYQLNVEVGPEEVMDTIENRVYFFKMFR